MKKSSEPQIEIKGYDGDGLRFYTAVSSSLLPTDKIRQLMGVSDGTFYGLYKKQQIPDKYKNALSKALNKTVEEIFDVPTRTNIEDTPQTDENQGINSGLIESEGLFSQLPQKDKETMDRILTILERLSVTGEINARTNEKNAEASLELARALRTAIPHQEARTSPEQRQRKTA